MSGGLPETVANSGPGSSKDRDRARVREPASLLSSAAPNNIELDLLAVSIGPHGDCTGGRRLISGGRRTSAIDVDGALELLAVLDTTPGFRLLYMDAFGVLMNADLAAVL